MIFMPFVVLIYLHFAWNEYEIFYDAAFHFILLLRQIYVFGAIYL